MDSFDGQWEECSLNVWLVERMLPLVVSGKNSPYIGGQCEECPLHWWSVGRMPIRLVRSG
ncbi:unnamed protein product, partial [Staurois parvus]